MLYIKESGIEERQTLSGNLEIIAEPTGMETHSFDSVGHNKMSLQIDVYMFSL